MCNPMAAVAVMAAISVAGTAYSQKAQADQAQSREKLLKRQAVQQEDAADEARNIDMAALDQRTIEQNQKTNQDILDRQRQAEREESMLRVASAEAGLLGNTVDRQLLTSALGASWDVGILKENDEAAQAQIELSRRSVEAQYKGRKNAASNTNEEANLIRKAQPSAAFNALQIFSSGASGASDGYVLGARGQTAFGNAKPYTPAK
jgi:hypothetical protein